MRVALKLRKIDPRRLNARQKENYHFQKISGLLADYGFTTIRLSDDWKGADFLAQNMDGETRRIAEYLKQFVLKQAWTNESIAKEKGPRSEHAALRHTS